MSMQCENCKELDKRMLKWLDHVGCAPRKFQRYDTLVEFVKMIAKESLFYGTDQQNNATLMWISTAATNLLKELDQNEFLRSNGFAKSRKESNPE